MSLEIVVTERLGEHVRWLFFGVDGVYRDQPSSHEVSEVMVLQVLFMCFVRERILGTLAIVQGRPSLSSKR
jgi:hypothetical protein